MKWGNLKTEYSWKYLKAGFAAAGLAGRADGRKASV